MARSAPSDAPGAALKPRSTEPACGALAAIVGCDTHLVNTRRILETLRRDFGAKEAALNRWCATWTHEGFDSVEALLAAEVHRGDYGFGRHRR